VPQPSCSGSGAWQKFSNPRSPITFSYPASWHLEVAKADVPGSGGDETLSLMCPDPMTIAYDMTVDFSPEKKGWDGSIADFIRFDGGPWMYGCDSDNREFCRKPIVTRRLGITIYRADEIEFRTYCVDSGYVGQGEGHRYLLSFKGKWIQFYGSGSPSNIMDRIVESVEIRK
jgi:hypothetical protein